MGWEELQKRYDGLPLDLQLFVDEVAKMGLESYHSGRHSRDAEVEAAREEGRLQGLSTLAQSCIEAKQEGRREGLVWAEKFRKVAGFNANLEVSYREQQKVWDIGE